MNELWLLLPLDDFRRLCCIFLKKKKQKKTGKF